MRPINPYHDSRAAAGGPGGRDPQRGLKLVGIVTSLLLHGAIAGGMVLSAIYAGQERAPQPELLEFQNVELLALGEEKPAAQLPRIANPEPPEVEEEAVNLAKPRDPEPEETPPEPKKEPKPQPEAQPRDSRRNKLLDQLEDLHNPNRPSNDNIPEGSADGVAGGTASDAAMANMMNTYQAQLLQALLKYWSVPTTLSDSEINALAGTVAVYVRLSDSGHVVSSRFVTKSGNEQFDSSIERLLRRFEVRGGRKLPMPDDAQVRELVVREGLNLTNWKAIAQ